MSHGWYAMHRGWMDHPVFTDSAYSEREAWLWLIENATHAERTVNVGGRPIKLQRGQLSYSVRFLAEAWDWNRQKTWRFLEKLKTWSQIGTDTETGQMIVTICNYSKYQDAQEKAGTDSGTAAGQQRDSSGTNNNNDNNENKRKRAVPLPFQLPDWISPEDWQDFEEMRRKMRRPMTDRARHLAVKRLDDLRAQGHDPSAVMQQSTLNCWTKFWPLKADGANAQRINSHDRQRQQADGQRLMEEVMGEPT